MLSKNILEKILDLILEPNPFLHLKNFIFRCSGLIYSYNAMRVVWGEQFGIYIVVPSHQSSSGYFLENLHIEHRTSLFLLKRWKWRLVQKFGSELVHKSSSYLPTYPVLSEGRKVIKLFHYLLLNHQRS